MMHRFLNILSSSSKDDTVDPKISARPIRLVYCDDNGKLKMNPDGVDALRLIKGPIGVVSVCGRARQGKSFILNQLLGRSNGFQVASTHRPCTKGLWIWSEPLKRTALDGTEYNLLLLDSEGIDAYDQTGTYSTQIFSLAVLLSSMFIYNQMGGIDEVALDRLSLVTEMTKHIRVRASTGRETVSELGQVSPIFVWLLRDFYLNLTEDNTKITPRDYLELALRPVLGDGKDIAAKNEIRESIRALFPDRECFTLVRPSNNETDLQRLDRIMFDKFRPEFQSGLDALMKFVFERTKPKQVGGTVMTGPVFAGITKSFLDALNNGAVPTISSSWQSVEESECRRAYDTATEIYISAFEHTKPPEEVSLREAHDAAVQKSIVAFDASAVGAGSARQKYEVLLQNFFKKTFEDYKRNAFMEADLTCSNAIQSMEKKLRAACQDPDLKIDHVVTVLDSLLSEYEASLHGPAKWQKLYFFLLQSLQGPLLNLAKKQTDQVSSDRSTLMLERRSIEDKMGLLKKQLEASEKFKTEYQKHYEVSITDMKKLSDHYKSRITDLESKCSSLEERCSCLLEMLDSTKQEFFEWKRKYEETLTSKNIDDDRVNAELEILKSRSSAAEARVAAAHEQAQSAQKEVNEWKDKYDTAIREAKAAMEKAAAVQECSNQQAQLREDALKLEFSGNLAKKEEEIKGKLAKLEYAEQCLTTLSAKLKDAESKIKNYDLETSCLKLQIKELGDKYESVKAAAESLERESQILVQEKIQLEQKYLYEFKSFEEAHERCKVAEKEVKMAKDFVDAAQTEVLAARYEQSDVQQLAIGRLAQIEGAQRHIESLERYKMELEGEVERYRVSERDVKSKVAFLEARVKEREEEIKTLLKLNHEQKLSPVHVLATGLDYERAVHREANDQGEALLLQLEANWRNSSLLNQQLIEISLDPEVRTYSRVKRSRLEVPSTGMDSVQYMDIDQEAVQKTKKPKRTMQKCMMIKDGDSVFMANEDTSESQKDNSIEYTKFTVAKLRQELTKHGFGAELLELKSPKKKDILDLYKKRLLQK